jgi:hypothetical protein
MELATGLCGGIAGAVRELDELRVASYGRGEAASGERHRVRRISELAPASQRGEEDLLRRLHL